MSENKLNIWKTQQRNYVNGFGCRFVVWVQGCHLACPDCWNKHTWSFDKKNEIPLNDLFAQIAAIQDINGVTFSGGEPFIQAKNLAKLAYRIKTELNLTLHIFTGFELKELTKVYQKKLLSLTDVLVTGRFDQSKPNNGQKVYEFGSETWNFNNTNVEIEIDTIGNIIISGYPDNQFIKEIKEIAT